MTDIPVVEVIITPPPQVEIVFPGMRGLPGSKGDDGTNAYELAVAGGFVGTEQDWLASLRGAKGDKGDVGDEGPSAYEVAVANGFVGTQSAWLATLKGNKGDVGDIGLTGGPGPIGMRGAPVDQALVRSIGDYLLTLVAAGSLFPWTLEDVNADGLAEHFHPYGNPIMSFAGDVWSIDNNPADGGTNAVFSDDFAVSSDQVPYAVGVQIDIKALGGGVSLVWEYHDANGAMLDPGSYDYVAATDLGPQLLQHFGPAWAGTEKLMVKVQLEPGASVDVTAFSLQVGTEITDIEPGGWIAVAPDHETLRPYMSNYAAMALAEATRTTGDTKYVEAAWTWLDWYRDHMDPDTGYVTDYDLVDGVLVVHTALDGSHYDSTDAYAGTYLMALKLAFLADYRKVRLEGHDAGVGLAIAAIQSTLQPNGLTQARDDWPVEYLEDNVEAGIGARCGAWCAKVIGDAALAEQAMDVATAIEGGIENQMWDQEAGAYVWAIHGDGTRVPTDWTLYNDAEQNVFAVAFGFATGSRAAAIMASFELYQPNWDIPAPDYHPIGLWGHDRIGSAVRQQDATDNLVDYSHVNDLAYPYDAISAGLLLLGITGGGIRRVGLVTGL